MSLMYTLTPAIMIAHTVRSGPQGPVVRVMGILTPMEGLLQIWEHFSNMKGDVGGNMHRDKRIELRIGRIKVLIDNLGRNINVDLI